MTERSALFCSAAEQLYALATRDDTLYSLQSITQRVAWSLAAFGHGDYSDDTPMASPDDIPAEECRQATGDAMQWLSDIGLLTIDGNSHWFALVKGEMAQAPGAQTMRHVAAYRLANTAREFVALADHWRDLEQEAEDA